MNHIVIEAALQFGIIFVEVAVLFAIAMLLLFFVFPKIPALNKWIRESYPEDCRDDELYDICERETEKKKRWRGN